MSTQSASENAMQREQRIASYWKTKKIFERSIEQRDGQKAFVFYEGPPTANGLPHAGHVLGRVIKDFVARYQTMKGHQVLRKAGWDTHGLPVELGVEKQLGLTGKHEIESYGVEAFIDQCKKSVFDYEKQWRSFTDAIGYWLDMDQPYKTMDSAYMETVWHILSTIHQKGLLEQGHRVVPYCPSCETSLSSHEVAQGYKDVKDLSAIATFPTGTKEAFLVWTTTPWTLPANVALAVNPDITYVKVRQDENVWIVAKNRVKAVVTGTYEVISEHKGSEFVDAAYEPPFSFLELKQGHKVIAADFVTEGSGTGVVHLAPAHGEDDYAAIRDAGLDFVKIVDEAGRYTAEAGSFAGQKVKESDVAIIKALAERGRLYSKEKYEHSYPHCWRCDSALIYYAMEGWFIKTTAMKQQIIANNQTVEWYPEHMRNGRFGNFLEGMVDWNIGRNRYWGTPLNVWICGDCGHQHAPDSIADLRARSIESLEEQLDLHKPRVDRITFSCEKCSGEMKRTKEVIDVWFDSGSMPFAQYHYPFENKELFERQFPADVIAEGVDQTRGWFYSLLTVSSLFTDKAPYKRVLSLGHILDADGRKMSKSKGNVLNPMELVEQFGADALRWALLADSAPWNSKRFSANLVAQAKSKLIDTLDNVHAFYNLYAAIDQFNPDEHPTGQPTELDHWLLSRVTTVTSQVGNALDQYDFTAAARELTRLVDDLSNWYIRRSRTRFWQEGMPADKLAGYHTLRHALITISQLLAPFTPFLADDIHLNLTGTSVHLSDFPQPDQANHRPQLEENMRRVLEVVELGRQLRNAASVKTKQPLASLTIVGDKADTAFLPDYEAIIRDELNVKQVLTRSNESDYVHYDVTLHFPTAGPKLGKKVRDVQRALPGLSPDDIQRVVNGDALTLEGVTLEPADLIVRRQAARGYELATGEHYAALLDTTLTDELKQEGFVRELIRAVQQERKDRNLPIDKRITLKLHSRPDILETLRSHQELLKQNILLHELHFGFEHGMDEMTVDGESILLLME